MPITHPKRENDFKLIFNNEIFDISKCLFGLYSNTFRHHPSFVFQQSLDMSEKGISNETFKEFVKACQSHFFIINEGNCYELLKLCEKWEVDVIKEEIINFINSISDSASQILKLKFFLSHDHSNNKINPMNQETDKEEKGNKKQIENRMQIINNIEESISQHINSYLGDPTLASLPISSLFRIISKSYSYHKSDSENNENKDSSESDSSQSLNNNDDYDVIDKHLFLKFLESVSNHHKEGSRLLIKLIDDYGEFTPSEHKKLKEVSNPFTDCNFSSDVTTFFNNLVDQNEEIDEFEDEISALRKEGEQNIKKIEGEVKTLRHSIRKNAKNSPSQSKSFSNLSSISESTKDALSANTRSPVLSNSTSNLEYAAKNSGAQSDTELDQNSVLTPENSPSKPIHHNQHPDVPIPPNSHLSPIHHHQINPMHEHHKNNSEILELLTQLLNQYNHMKIQNLDVSKSVQNYTEKLTEFSQRCDQITVQIQEEKEKAREKAKEIEKLNQQQQQQQKQSEQKPKSFSSSSKTTEKNSSKSQKHNSSSKGKSKEKSNEPVKENNNDSPNEVTKISVPKANFQIIKQNNKRQSHSVKEPDRKSRVSFSEKSSSKHSKLQKTTSNSPQSAATPQSITVHNGQGIITVLPNNDINNFNGLIYQLRCLNTSRDLNGNLAIRASSTKMAIAQPENVLKSESVWCTENRENQWILFDFVSRRINISNYKIKTIPYQTNSFHMKSWVVEGNEDKDDPDENSWILIDKRENNSLLNKSSAIAIFDVSSHNDKFFRYIRLRMIGPNHTNTNVFAFAQIEFFGSLKFGGDL